MAGLIYWCLLFLTLLFSSSHIKGDEEFFRKDYHYIASVKNFYKIHKQLKTWVDAKQRCEWEGATLYYPISDVEAEAVRDFAQQDQISYTGYWIGISSLLSEGVFVTIDGLPMTDVYNKWNVNEPNNVEDDEYCVENSGFGMNDINCMKKKPFICKKTLASLQWNTQCQMPYEDYTYNETLGKCYKFHMSRKSWTEAHAICISELSYLAIIDSKDEADFFSQVLTDRTPKYAENTQLIYKSMAENEYAAHLGFHNKFGHDWRTVKDVLLENTGYPYWHGRGYYYDEDIGQCGGMAYSGWLSVSNCDDRHYFVCEHDVVKPQTLTGTTLV